MNGVNFSSHLDELRRRLIYCTVALIGVVAICYPYNNTIFNYFMTPVIKDFSNINVIATKLSSTFTIPLKLNLLLALFLLMPYILYQIWAFISPALYQNEKKNVLPFLVTSVFLFYLGATFAYFIVCPMVVKFFINVSPSKVQIMADINNYYDFIINIIFAFGIAFQTPILSYLLVKHNVISKSAIKQIRKYIIVGAFTIGMILTPPDVLSQVMLAIPIWLLFEIGYFSANVVSLRAKKAIKENTF